MGKGFKTFLLLCSLAWATIALSQNKGIDLRLREGETSAVRGTALSIHAARIRDFTSEGCEGGPRGCPDHADLQVSRGKNREAVTLHLAHTRIQKNQGINKAKLFGYEIILTAIQDKMVTLSIQRLPEIEQKEQYPQQEQSPKKE